MPRVPPTLQNLPSKDPNWLHTRNTYERVARTINGNLSFGGGSGPMTAATATPTTQGLTTDNIAGVWIKVLTPAAGSDFTVTHNLNKIISGYLIMLKDNPVDIYVSPNNATLTNAQMLTEVIFRATAAGVSVHMFIF